MTAVTAMARIIGNLKPEDDYPHALGGEANFNESMYFNLFDARQGVGGFLRLGSALGMITEREEVMEDTQTTEVRRLLKAYRKGLITEELFAEQMAEVYGNGNGKTYAYNGRTYASEREMVRALLDGFRSAEAFGAESLQGWIACCQVPCLRGGLRTICHREAYHARLLEERLRELGGDCRAQIPDALRQEVLTAVASRELTDLQKLQGAVARVSGAGDVTADLRQAVDQIEDDQETKQILRTILDDEAATVRWLRETCEALSGNQARAAAAGPSATAC
jgi:hypothetical protein